MMSNSSLLQFLKYDINMHQNYQPIVIKMLLESENHISSIPEIKNKLIVLDEIKDRIYQNNKTKSPNLKFEEWIPVKDDIIEILKELFMK